MHSLSVYSGSCCIHCLYIQVASVDAVAEFIGSWDIGQTESLLNKLEIAKERRAEEDRLRREAEQEK